MHQRVAEYIKRAQAMGSKTKTLRGAGKWILAGVKPVEEKGSFIGKRTDTREKWKDLQHKIRLTARYAGAKRLPKYLTARDRAVIENSSLRLMVERFRGVPSFVQAFYITPGMRECKALAGEIKRAEKAIGILGGHPLIAEDAHRRHNWGLLKIHSAGACVPPGNVRIREVGSNWDWNVRSTLERFADYCLIVPKVNRAYYKGWYLDSDRVAHTVAFSPGYLKIDGQFAQRHGLRRKFYVKLPVHVQRRMLAMVTPSVLTIGYAENMLTLTDATGETYHVGYLENIQRARKAVAEALAAFRKRREEKIEEARIRSNRVWIDLEDSYRSGNCRPMSDQFARQVWSQIGAAGPCAVRADVVLGIRDDAYTRRAAMAALTR